MSDAPEKEERKLSPVEAIIRAAEDYAPDANTMLVLIELARLMYSTRKDAVHPSHAWIAWRTRLGPATVARIVAKLRKLNILEPTGETLGRGRTVVYRINVEAIERAFEKVESWDDVKDRLRSTKRSDDGLSQRESVKSANAGDGLSQRESVSNGTKPSGNGSETRRTINASATDYHGEADGLSRDPRRTITNAATDYHSDRQGFTEGIRTEGFNSEGQFEGRGGGAARAPRAVTAATSQPTPETPTRASGEHVQQQHASQRAAPPPGKAIKNAALQPTPHEIDAIALAMVDAFHPQCEANVREEVVSDCRRFAAHGLDVDDMRAAIRTARREQKKLGNRPRWASVRKVLEGVLHTREPVVSGFGHKCSGETLDAARRLEAIFERYLDKPAWTANSHRWSMGQWLVMLAARRVDAAAFEAVCRAVKKHANGKVPTWKDVKAALGVPVEPSPPVADKPFFDRPGSVPGTFIAPGNSTRH